jgi:hypothetical protein
MADRGPGGVGRGPGAVGRGPGAADRGPRGADRGPGGADRGPGTTAYGPGPRGGAHALRPGDTRLPPPPPPSGPVGPRGNQRSPDIRPILFLAAAAAIIAVGAVVAAVLLSTHHSPARHTASSTPPASHPAHSPSSRPSPPPTPTPAQTGNPPPRTGANGHLGVPGHIGSLKLTPSLTGKYVGPKVRRQFANSFFIPAHDVVSGFYTTNPSATTFNANDHRLMYLAAYLHGTGNAKSALHSFMTNDTFNRQHQVHAGPPGGKAACAELAHQATPVAHCMWVDGNSYADFYAWNTSPSELATTMRAIRPEVERTHS